MRLFSRTPFESNEASTVKAWLELLKDATSCFKQMLEASPKKKQQFTSLLTIQPNESSKTRRTLQEK